MSALAWLGRQGTRATTVLVFIGIAMPPVDAVLKRFVPEAVFILLCIAFVRVDAAALRGSLARPVIVLAATVWTMVLVPVLFGASCLAVGLGARAPDLELAVMLQALASPMMAAPSLAALMGLDATLVLVTLVTSSALLPLTAPLFAYVFVGPALTLSPLALGGRLFTIVAGSVLTAVIIRRIVGIAAITRYKPEIDGFNILVMFVFVAAVMEHVAERALAVPMVVLGLLALALVVFFGVFGLTALLFAGAGRERALALGFMTSQRNMGIMAAAASVLPDLAWLYFAMCQFPIFLAPQLLGPLITPPGASSPSASRYRSAG